MKKRKCCICGERKLFPEQTSVESSIFPKCVCPDCIDAYYKAKEPLKYKHPDPLPEEPPHYAIALVDGPKYMHASAMQYEAAFDSVKDVKK